MGASARPKPAPVANVASPKAGASVPADAARARAAEVPAVPPAPAAGGRGVWMFISVIAVMVGLGVRALVRDTAPAREPVTVDASPAEPLTAAAAPTPVDNGPSDPGELVREYHELAQPPGRVTDEDCGGAQSTWLFPEMSDAQVRQQLRDAGFSGAPLAGLESHLRCEANGCSIDASDAVLLSLPGEARGRIYRFLGRYNGAMFSAIPFRRPLRFGRWEDIPGVPPRVRDVLRRASWVESDTQYFVDVASACRTLGDATERRQLFEYLNRRYLIELSVRVGPDTELAPLVRYWSSARPPEVVRGIFERAQRAAADAGFGLVNVREFLPTMARRRLDTFPRREDPPFDCFWTSLRFFDDAAESVDPPGNDGFVAELGQRWERIPADHLRFGDMIVLYDHGNPVHAMTHVADDLVFTKNGGSLIRPWLLMSGDDVRRDYVFSTETRIFRRRPR